MYKEMNASGIKEPTPLLVNIKIFGILNIVCETPLHRPLVQVQDWVLKCRILGLNFDFFHSPHSAYHGHVTSLIDISPYKFHELHAECQKEFVHIVSIGNSLPFQLLQMC